MSDRDAEESDRDADADRLGRLFVRVTGVTSVSDPQQAESGASHVAPTDGEEYKRHHDALSRHDALRDAIPVPETR